MGFVVRVCRLRKDFKESLIVCKFIMLSSYDLFLIFSLVQFGRGEACYSEGREILSVAYLTRVMSDRAAPNHVCQTTTGIRAALQHLSACK